MADCPPRARLERPEELGFTRRNRMVSWFSPRELSGTALQVLLSATFGAYSDKREIQAALEPTPSLPYTGELWVDFVADLGDGFGPTYSVASLLAAKTLDVGLPGEDAIATRRGQVLVMGGDEVYPTPSIESYHDKTLGPYRAALPYTERDHPHLYAIPGNHDWYDGLTAFMRVFCQGPKHWIGGWQTQQSRSYFALQLAHGWWLWGIDVQFETYIDTPQLRYFENVPLEAGDSIILCSAVPSWIRANRDRPEAYVTLDYLEREVIREREAAVRLALTGDSHHYARYEGEDGAQRITAGGGGAYLSATHHLPDKLVLPPEASRDPGKSTPSICCELKTAYPTKEASRRLRWGIAAPPFKNGSFWAMVGAVHLLYAWMIQAARRPPGLSLAGFFANASLEELALGILGSPLALLVSGVIVWGLMGFTTSKVRWKRAMGALHGLLHLALIALTVRLAAMALQNAAGAAFLAGFIPLVGVGGGLLGSWLMAAYLLLADRVGSNTNELFSAQRIRDYKNFLRLHLDRTGAVTVYPIKVERTPRRWRLRQGGAEDAPWFEPVDGPLQAQLIEPPVRVEPARSRATVDSDLRRAAP